MEVIVVSDQQRMVRTLAEIHQHPNAGVRGLSVRHHLNINYYNLTRVLDATTFRLGQSITLSVSGTWENVNIKEKWENVSKYSNVKRVNILIYHVSRQIYWISCTFVQVKTLIVLSDICQTFSPAASYNRDIEWSSRSSFWFNTLAALSL